MPDENIEQVQSDLDAANAFIDRLCEGIDARVTDAEKPVTRANVLATIEQLIDFCAKTASELEKQRQVAHHLAEILRIRGVL